METTVAQVGWLRRNRGWLAGALVLGTLAFVLPWRAAVHEYGRRGFTHPVEGRARGWNDYAGARWRLVAVRRDDVPGVAADYPHSEASRVLVVYEVIAGKDTDIDTLGRCVGRLADARGRHWGGQAIAMDEFNARVQRQVEDTLQLDTSCAERTARDGARVRARPTRPFRFFHGYLVPRDVSLDELSAEIVVDPFNTTPPGSYLRFRLADALAPSPGA